MQSIFSPDATDNPNVNLARIGERYIAMTETPMPIEFDPETLETVGQLEYADKLKAHVTTAHPHHDPERDELVNYHAYFSRVSKYVLYGLPAGSSARRVIAELPVKEPSYMHAFGMSGRHLILAEYPLRVNPLKMAFSGKPFIQNYTWRPGAARSSRWSTGRPARCAAPTRRTPSSASTTSTRSSGRTGRAGGRPDRLRRPLDHRRALPGRRRPARTDSRRPSCAAT